MISWFKLRKFKKLQTKAREVLSFQGNSLRGVTFDIIADPDIITHNRGSEVPYIAHTSYETIKSIGFLNPPQIRKYVGCSKIVININSVINLANMRDEDPEEFLLKILSHIILCLSNNCDPTWYENAVA